MSQRNSYAAIMEIKSWSVDDVLTVLNKNGLGSTCAVFKKRVIDGEDLLNLTEGKLALWKRDLSLGDIRKLSRFIHDLNTTPERFHLIDHGRQNGASYQMPLPPLPPRPHTPEYDEGWGSDFEDTAEDVYSVPPDDGDPPPPLKPNAGFLNSAPLVQHLHTRAPTLDSVKPPIPSRPVAMPPGKPYGGNHSALFGGLPKPPTPHLENLISNLNLSQPNGQEEYEYEEYTSIEEGVGCDLHSLGFAPPPPRVAEPPLPLPPRKITPAEQSPIALPQRKLTPQEQPPLRKLTPTEQSPSRKLTPTEQPTLEAIRGASPTPYPKFFFTSRSRPPAVLPQEDAPHFNNIPAGIPNQMSALSNKGLKPAMPLPPVDPRDYEQEEYECIEDPAVPPASTDYYLHPIAQASPASTSPTLPAKPTRGVAAVPDIVTPSFRPPSPPRKKSYPDDVPSAEGGKLSDKLRSLMKMRQVSSSSSTDEPVREKSPMPELQKPPPVERPGPGPRPLPPTPDAARKPGQDKMNPRRNSRVFTQMPWYHNVDRKRAEEMLKNGEDGKFLMRPSMQTQNPLTLTLWYNKRLYNISVRQRADLQYALGTDKPNEYCFSSVEELVQHYQGEELVLYSGGERTGKTLLTSSPPRQSS